MSAAFVIYLILTILFVLLLAALIIGYELLRRDFRKLQREDRSAEAVDRAERIQNVLGELKGQIERAADARQQNPDSGRFLQEPDGSSASDPQAYRVLQKLRTVREQFDRLTDAIGALGAHLDHTCNRFDAAERQLRRFTQTLADVLDEPAEADLALSPMPFDLPGHRPTTCSAEDNGQSADARQAAGAGDNGETAAPAVSPVIENDKASAAGPGGLLLPSAVPPFKPTRAKRRRRR